jgi:DNA-binding NtrC family response regulator
MLTVKDTINCLRQKSAEAGRMPAQVVLVHDDPLFVEEGATALCAAGYEVAAFTDPMLALNALDAARTIELLITRITYPPGKPNGLALARMARTRRPQIRILLMAIPEAERHAKGWGEHLPLPATIAELVEATQRAFESESPNSN